MKTFHVNADAAQLAWQDTSSAASGDYYYLRVTQRDSNRAWTSPI